MAASQNNSNRFEGSPSDDEGSTGSSSSGFDRSSTCKNASDEPPQIAADEKLPMPPGQAAAVIQGMYRGMKARELCVSLVRQTYEKVYDEENDIYFYYNKIHDTSRWSAPRALQGQSLDPKEEWAAQTIQCLLRKRLAWKKLLSIMNSVYEKEYDPDTGSWFYVNKVTKHTTWEKPSLFGIREPPTHTSDQALLRKDFEIQELRKELERQKADAQEAKKALENRIIEERVRSGELDPDEARGRDKHMDEWDVNTVVAWFHSLGYKQFDQSIREHQVDGLLLLHLMNEDWGNLGITSPLAIRRIEIAMLSYRLRFEQKQRSIVDDGDGISAASASDTPSELMNEEDPCYDEDRGAIVDDGDEISAAGASDTPSELMNEEDPCYDEDNGSIVDDGDGVSAASASDTPSELMNEEDPCYDEDKGGIVDDGDGVSAASASDTPSELMNEEGPCYNEDNYDLQEEKGYIGKKEGTVDVAGLTELQCDEENMTKEIIFRGEEKRGRPAIGDVVRIHYTCALQAEVGGRNASGSEAIQVESSRRNRRRPLEFVVGSGQVVKGVDLGVRTMLHGERARIFVSPSYAYGDKGCPPIIPPGATLVFEVNLLDFWPRPRWIKPLVQVLSEEYAETPYARRSVASCGSVASVDVSKDDELPQESPYGKVGKH